MFLRVFKPLFIAALAGVLFSAAPARTAVPQGESARRPAPNVLLITVDTLRADHVGAYGYRKNSTPALDRLVREGVRFASAFTPVPLTLPAHCSLMTGLYPSHHGVRDNSGFVLPADQLTLAEIFKNAGYETGAFVGAFVLDSKFGLAQGFDTYFDNFDLSRFESISPGYIQRTGDEVAGETIRWLEGRKNSGRPFFAWSHFYDPHDPYTPPQPYRSRHPNLPYDGEIEFTDANVGALLDWLRRNDMYNNTLVVVAGDHGESLGEHGESKHGFFIYNATLHVPLIMKFPRGEQAGRVVEQAVSLVDVFPTILQIAPVSRVSSVHGKGLVSLALGKAPTYRPEIYAECYYPRLQFGWSELRALITDRHKYILSPQPELYDHAADFGESRDLIGTQSVLANRLRDTLRGLIQRYSSGPKAQSAGHAPDAETREKLRSLGYVSMGMGNISDNGFEKLRDPKHEIGTYNEIVELFERSAAADYRAVIPRYEEILKRQPNLKILHYKLGQAYFQTGRYQAALREYKTAVELGGDAALATYDMALAYMKLGRADDAIVGLKHTVAMDPAHYRARTNLGVLLRERGDADEAVKQLEEAVKQAPRYVLALSNLAISYSMAERHQEAESAIRRAVVLSPDDGLLRANLATVLHRMGKADEARQQMDLARKLNPRLGRPTNP